MRKLFVVLAAMLLLALISCGGGGSSNAAPQPGTASTVSDPVNTGGDNASPDANLVVVNFTDTASAQSSSSAKQASLSTRLWAVMKDVVNGDTYSLGAVSPSEWISQHDSSCVNEDNGYCGFASVMMGVKYLSDVKSLNLNIKPPLPTGWSNTTQVSTVVNNYSKGTLYFADYKNFGGLGLRYPDDMDTFSNALGIYGESFTGDSTQAEAENWIKDALKNNYPVVVWVHYQGASCTGQGWSFDDVTGSEARDKFYQGGRVTNEMTTCYEVIKTDTFVASNKDYSPLEQIKESCGTGCIIKPMGHYVMVAEINDSNSSVLVYDPDPNARTSDAGIRRYSKTSFFKVLKTFYNDTLKKLDPNFKPRMYKLCSTAGCPQVSNAFSTTAGPVVLSTNKVYSTSSTSPVVVPLVSNSTFSATGLPSGLSIDTEGRIVGSTGNTASNNIVQVTMINTANNISRSALQSINVVIEDNVIEALQFITQSLLNVATVGNAYLQSLGITGTAETPTFSLTSGNLPPGLTLQPNQIIGTPTQAGTYSFDITVSTSTSNVTKTFTHVVNPASVVVVPAPPVLSGINPPSITGMDDQQTVVFTGSGFSDGARVELTDMTNGGTYEKIPVSINSAGTEITISANFTSNPATWSARVIPLTGNPSGTITFSVIAPVNACPVISSVSPNAPTASTSAQTITITGNNYRTGAVVEITNLATGARTDLSPSTLTSVQIVVNCTFDAATQWSIRIINSDGTSSANTYITVNAPASTTVPAIPSLVSPGTATGPGTVLSNTTASLSWSSDASASYYAVAVRDLGSGSLVVDTTTNTPSYSVNLLEGKQYRWNAAACNAAGCSSYAAPLYFQTPGAAATTVDVQPLNVTIGSSSVTAGGSLLVSWQIRNNGTGTASTSNSQVRITTSNAAGGYGNSSNNVGSAQATGTIAAGATISQSTTVTVPSTPGTYYVWVIADNNSNLSQTNVNNDEVVCTTALTVTAATVTPSVSSISPTSMTADNLSHTLTIYGSNFASGDVVQFMWGQGTGANVWTISNHTPTVNSSSQITVSMNPGTVADTIYVRVCSGSNCSSGAQYVSVH
jgi:hypothetical protein